MKREYKHFGNNLRGTRVLHGFRRTHAWSERNAPDNLLRKEDDSMKLYEIPCLTFVTLDEADVLRTSGEGPNETPKIDFWNDLDP